MPMTPNEILEKKFAVRFRGYDRQEVASFLEEVANSLASVIQERNELRDKVLMYKKQIVRLKHQEAEFRNALTTAHQVAEDMKISAEQEGKIIIERARLDAERIVSDAHQEAIQLEDRIRKLRMLQRESVHKMRSSFESFLRILDDEMILPPEEIDETLRVTASQVRAIQETDAKIENEDKGAEAKEEETATEPLSSDKTEPETPPEEKTVEEPEEISDKIINEEFDFEPAKLWPEEEKK